MRWNQTVVCTLIMIIKTILACGKKLNHGRHQLANRDTGKMLSLVFMVSSLFYPTWLVLSVQRLNRAGFHHLCVACMARNLPDIKKLNHASDSVVKVRIIVSLKNV